MHGVSSHRIVLDWGTSTFRAVLVDGAGVAIDRVETKDGIQSVPKGGFEAALMAAIAPWRAVHGVLPIYASGMIGSRNGWVEMPYIPVPCGAPELAGAVRRVTLGDGGTITFVPGLTDLAALPFPDVIRGEETQLVGLGLDDDTGVVMPGTHSKWVRVAAGKIQRFQTLLTGELFAIISRHSFVAQMAKPPAMPDWDAFARGLNAALDPAMAPGLLARLFSVRTGWLAGKLKPEEATDYLSGLVIGCEFREARGLGWFAPGERLGIIGNDELSARYERAAKACGLSSVKGPADAALRGCLAIAAIAEENAHAA